MVLLNQIYDCKFFDYAFSIAPISTIQKSITYININNMSGHSEGITEYFNLIEKLRRILLKSN